MSMLHRLFVVWVAYTMTVDAYYLPARTSVVKIVNDVRVRLSHQLEGPKIIDRSTLFEGDVVEYSRVPINPTAQMDVPLTSLAAVTCNRKLQPLYRRDSDTASDDELFLYGDDDEKELVLTDPSITITAVLDDFQYTQRIVEDRVSNPHGEHAEDVWILRGVSSIDSVINNPDLYLRVGPFQH